MTFLQLCARLRQESGFSDGGPSSVVGQTGELLLLVNWVNEAYRQVQNLFRNWDFLRADFSFPTVSGTATYSKTTVTDLGNWKRDSLKIYLSSVDSEQWVTYVPWEDFRALRLFGASQSATGWPFEFTIKPDKSLMFWPIPDDVYTVTGEYFLKAQQMSVDADEPLVPEEYQLIIVWRALMLYAANGNAPTEYAHGEKEYKALLSRLEFDQLPAAPSVGPLV